MDIAIGTEGRPGNFWFRNTVFKGLFLCFFLGSKRAVAEVWDRTSRNGFLLLNSNTISKSVLYICPDCKPGR